VLDDLISINLGSNCHFDSVPNNAAFRDDDVGAGLVPARPAPSGAGNP
jgi:hypothetical protein